MYIFLLPPLLLLLSLLFGAVIGLRLRTYTLDIGGYEPRLLLLLMLALGWNGFCIILLGIINEYT